MIDEKLWHRHKWPEGMPYELEYPVMPLQQVLDGPEQLIKVAYTDIQLLLTAME